jgi:YHS domain-containing protein
MKQFKFLTVMFAILLVAAFTVYAEDAKTESKTEAPKELKNQTHCPVMGGPIDSTVFTDIQGQRVYHCCAGCQAPLKADPDKFFKKAAADGILFENIQTTCPVSGEELKEETAFTDFEGRRIYFCCEGCVETFGKDAQAFLSKMDKAGEETKETKEPMKPMKSGHSGHNHGGH